MFIELGIYSSDQCFHQDISKCLQVLLLVEFGFFPVIRFHHFFGKVLELMHNKKVQFLSVPPKSKQSLLSHYATLVYKMWNDWNRSWNSTCLVIYYYLYIGLTMACSNAKSSRKVLSYKSGDFLCLVLAEQSRAGDSNK